jgi:hypothetical protein
MIRAFQWDLARQVERLDWLLAQLPRYADWGYNELYLHLEDAIAYPSLPKVARKDAYSYRHITQLVRTAERSGIKVVPIVNLLGHTQYLIKVPELRDLNELCAADGSPLERGQICPVHPRTMEVAEKLLRDVAPLCTAGKVHVGLDESFHLGKHPRSRREIARLGLAAHFARYVGRLNNLAKTFALRTGMWGDMLYFLPDAVPLLPTDVAVYEWYYYAFKRRPRVELFNFAETDLGERLRARGMEYWGCPMNGAFRHEPVPHFSDRLDNISSWWQRCRRLQAAGLLVTSWEPNRLAMELTTVVDAAAASLWLDGDTLTKPEMLRRGFERVFGRSGSSTAARAALACDRYPFSGYPRWEINARWDVISRRESVTPYRAEKKYFGALMKSGGGSRSRLPKPLQTSIEFRWYLAARDVFVHEAQRSRATDGRNAKRDGQEFRAALRRGKQAARAMWVRTRDRHEVGPNEHILVADAQRFDAWRGGEAVMGAAWQLCYRVHNLAPAVQFVAVEQRLADGTWVARQSCYTIEFQARAAQPRSIIVREHAAPIDWDGNRRTWPRLRFVLRGMGKVRISAVALYNGNILSVGRLHRNILGMDCSRSGFPNLRPSDDCDRLSIRFDARSW